MVYKNVGGSHTMSLKTATKQENGRVELEVEIDAETFEAAVAKIFKKSIGKMNVPGFRPGKAPRHLVEKMYGEDFFYEDAMNDLYPDALEAAVKEAGYEFVEDKVDLDVVSVGKEGLVFKAAVTVKPEIELGEYKGLKAGKKAEAVTEKEVDEELARMQDKGSRLVAVEDAAVAAETGDTVVFDFEGFADGAPFQGGKAESYTLELGSGQFIPGFEDQIIGKKTDEAFDVTVTFPEDYQAAELAGKEAVFKCRLHEIKKKELPELNDDFAKDCSEFDTLDELKADIRKKMEDYNEHQAEHAFENALTDQLAAIVTGDIPEAMFNNAVEADIEDFEHRLSHQGMKLEHYLQYADIDMDGLKAEFRPNAEKKVKVRLALEAIVKKENIEPTEEDIGAEYNRLAEQYHMETEKIKEAVSKEDLTKDVAVGKAMDLVKESAVEPETEAAPKPKKTTKKADE